MKEEGNSCQRTIRQIKTFWKKVNNVRRRKEREQTVSDYSTVHGTLLTEDLNIKKGWKVYYEEVLKTRLGGMRDNVQGIFLV